MVIGFIFSPLHAYSGHFPAVPLRAGLCHSIARWNILSSHPGFAFRQINVRAWWEGRGWKWQRCSLSALLLSKHPIHTARSGGGLSRCLTGDAFSIWCETPACSLVGSVSVGSVVLSGECVPLLSVPCGSLCVSASQFFCTESLLLALKTLFIKVRRFCFGGLLFVHAGGFVSTAIFLFGMRCQNMHLLEIIFN